MENTNEVNEQNIQDSNPPFMTLQQAAKYLEVSKSYLYKLTHNHVIPFCQPGGKLIYFVRADIDAYVLKSRIDPEK